MKIFSDSRTVGILGLFFSFIHLAPTSAFGESKAHSIQVLQLTGKATETRGAKEISIQQGSQLKSGSLIRLEKDSAMVVRFGQDVVAKLAGGMEGKIREIEGKDWELELQRGVTAAAIRNPNQRPKHYQVRTQSVVMGVRGTVFYVEALEQKPVFVCTCTGKVAMESLDGKELTTVIATHHDHPLTIETSSAQTQPVLKPAPVGNGHSDADVEFLQKTLVEING